MNANRQGARKFTNRPLMSVGLQQEYLWDLEGGNFVFLPSHSPHLPLKDAGALHEEDKPFSRLEQEVLDLLVLLHSGSQGTGERDWDRK